MREERKEEAEKKYELKKLEVQCKLERILMTVICNIGNVN